MLSQPDLWKRIELKLTSPLLCNSKMMLQSNLQDGENGAFLTKRIDLD